MRSGVKAPLPLAKLSPAMPGMATAQIKDLRRATACQAQQHLGLEVSERLFIGLRRRMVGFVDDDIVVVISGKPLMQRLGVQRLHRHEQMLQALRAVVAHIELAEVEIFQHPGEGRLALLQYFFPMGDEQQSVGLPGILFAKATLPMAKLSAPEARMAQAKSKIWTVPPQRR